MRSFLVVILFLTSVCRLGPALAAAECDGDFASWLEHFKTEAASNGVSQDTLAAGLDGVSPDPIVLSHDRRQGVFRQSFEQFAGRMVPPRLQRGASLSRQHAALFGRIEQQFGVPGPILVAIWGLETDYGADVGRFPTIRALATLAHDCRRPDRFRPELIDTLRIIQRGDMTAAEMRGAWAGEIGQTQFLPSSYLKYAVDYDGNGRRDLIRSVPDALASTANYLQGYGWKRGEPWGEGTANFDVIREWNKATVYSKTIAYFAESLAGPSR